MSEYDFDLFTVGGGSGGVAASRRAGAHGARVALCEDQAVGGTCVHRGCVPKKLLVYGAHFREAFEDARGYGWSLPEPLFDGKKLQMGKDRELARLDQVYRRLLKESGVRLIEGRGRLVDAHTVEVAGSRYTAKYILVATGSHPFLPGLPGIEHAITSDEALRLPEPPGRVAIVGGGYIGVEFAGIFNALGSRVTIFLRGGSVLRGFDEDVRETLAQEMRKKGIALRPQSTLRGIEKGADGTLSVRTGLETVEVDTVLFATGRVPNTRGLGLEAVGVELDERGAVKVDGASRTRVESIYAVGDVTDRLNLTPVAIAEGRAVAETLFNDNPIQMDHSNVASAVFSQPPVGTVGCTEHEARREHGAVDVYVSDFKPMKHVLSGRDERVMIKVIVARDSDRVVGMHMVGADAPEIIQGMAVALKCGVTKKQLDATVGIHPTLAEEFVTLRTKRPGPEDERFGDLGRDAPRS